MSSNELAAIKTMDAATKIKAALDIQAGDIDTDGILLVSLVTGGSWYERSYKTM